MKINEASRTSGLSRDMIRYYEKLGLVRPKRLPNGYRDYSDDDLYLLTVIKYLSNLGVPLKHISKAFETGQSHLLEARLRAQVDALNLLKKQLSARIAAAQDSIDCFRMFSAGISWEVYQAGERFLISFGSLQYPEFHIDPDGGDFFQFYYRQRYRMGEQATALGPADRGILLYNPMPEAESVPPQPCLRAILTHPAGSLLGADDLRGPLRRAQALTGRTGFTVLIHQFFQDRHHDSSAVLCAEILLES